MTSMSLNVTFLFFILGREEREDDGKIGMGYDHFFVSCTKGIDEDERGRVVGEVRTSADGANSAKKTGEGVKSLFISTGRNVFFSYYARQPQLPFLSPRTILF